MRKVSTAKRNRASGFTLIEMMMVMLILTIVTGVVFRDIASVQQRERAEELRTDITQTAREFLDEVVRDLHQAGYPNPRMYTGGAVASDSRIAAGLSAVSATDIWFEGDVDGDGVVDSVRYQLQSNGGNCPCTLRRSQVVKINGVAPTAQTTTFNTEVNGVVNSNNVLPISGTTLFAGGPAVNNDVTYASYKVAPIFTYFDINGAQVAVPNDLSGGNLATGSAAATLASIKSVRITINVLSPTVDIQTRMFPAISMTGSAKLIN